MFIHSEKLRWLFWLRWKMFTRSFSRKGVARIIGTVFLSLFVLIVGGGLATGTFFAYRFLPTPANTEVLFLVTTALFIVWIVLPLLEFQANEGLDISKLALFPLTRGELMASLIFSTLLDIPTIGLILVLGAVVAGFGTSLPLLLMTLLIMLVFYVQLVAASQLVLALLQKVLQSRRFRDISIILIVLLSSSGYMCQLAIRGAVANKGFTESLTHATISPYVQWLPSGMAARAVQQAVVGNWGFSVIWLVALAAVTLLFLFLWQMVVARGLTTEESSGTAKTVRHRQHAITGETTVQTASTGLISRILPTQVRAMVTKELKYYWRDPQIKALLLQSLVSMGFLFVYFGFNFFNSSNSGSHIFSNLGQWVVLIAPLFILLTLYTLTYNTLGFERQSITTLFLFPIEPKYILWGKNIAVFIIGLTAQILIIALATIITHAWSYIIPALVVAIAGTSITIGLGNFTSVFFPQKMRQARRGFQTSSSITAEGGCLRLLASSLAFYGMLIILIPVAAAVVIPILLNVQWIWVLSLPLSLVYGVGFYLTLTTIVSRRMLSKVPEIINAVAKE